MMEIVEKQIKDVPSSSTTYDRVDQEEEQAQIGEKWGVTKTMYSNLTIATLGFRIRKQTVSFRP